RRGLQQGGRGADELAAHLAARVDDGAAGRDRAAAPPTAPAPRGPRPVTALRLANVPTPKGTCAVSPPTTVTQSSGTPSASAATWAKLVSCPCPELIAPVATSTRPARSSFTLTPSNGPMAVPST